MKLEVERRNVAARFIAKGSFGGTTRPSLVRLVLIAQATFLSKSGQIAIGMSRVLGLFLMLRLLFRDAPHVNIYGTCIATDGY